MKLEIGMTLLLSYITHNLLANEQMVTSQMATPSLELLQFLGEWQDENGQFVEPELLDSEPIQTQLNRDLKTHQLQTVPATKKDNKISTAVEPTKGGSR